MLESNFVIHCYANYNALKSNIAVKDNGIHMQIYEIAIDK